MPALLALLAAFGPLIPMLVPQIENLISSIGNKGSITPEIEEKIHALKLAVHAEVQRIVAERAAEG